MTYEEVLNAIHSRKTFSGGGATLDRIRRLMKRLDDPQEKFKVIHVAGTNGKGSTCAMIHAALQKSGYTTGLFTSPYLKDFRERIQINGEMISRDMLISCYRDVILEQERLEGEGYEPVNEFELVTAIAFLAFSRAGLDYVVLEVGLGGRTDPTNLISRPAVCCITPISPDHTAILGDTIEAIAGEKAGIIKPGCPVVISPQTEDARRVFEQTAREREAPLYYTAPVTPISMTKDGSRFLCGDTELFIPLLGAHQLENAATAYRVLQLLHVDPAAIKAGFATVSWPGRLQYIPGKPSFLIDAGHNQAGVAALCEALDQLFSDQPVIAVMAMMKDKDYSQCIPAVARRTKGLIGTTVGLPRSLSPREISQIASAYCPTNTADHMSEAIQLAGSIAGDGDLILICGSVYAAGDALQILD